MTLLQTFLIAAAGATGVLLRFFCDQLTLKLGFASPVGTLTVNVIGCFVAGMIFTMSADRAVLTQSQAQVLLIGLCGGFTTFSAYALQSFQMLSSGQTTAAVAYLTLSPILGVAAVYIGQIIALR